MGLMRELGKLDHDVTLLRFRLQRILQQEKKWEADHPEGDAMEAYEAVFNGAQGLLEGMDLDTYKDTSAGADPGRTIQLRKPDWNGLILQFENAIGRMEERRSKLIEESIRDEVRKIQDTLKNRTEDGKEESSS